MLLREGFSGLDPSHPLGGKDSGKDAVCFKNGERWVMAVSFPRGQQSFTRIKVKFSADLTSARASGVQGIAFVTNQELTLAERNDLNTLAPPLKVELYHLERITAILDSPPMANVRKQFLGIDLAESAKASEVEHLNEQLLRTQNHLQAIQTGGDSFCYFMLYNFDLHASVAREFVVIPKGEYTLYDVRIRIRDMDAGRDLFERAWGEINAPADFLVLKWSLPPSAYYRIFFHARNGSWNQDLILKRSEAAKCWLAATRVLDRSGLEVVLQHIDNQFIDEFGVPAWRT